MQEFPGWLNWLFQLRTDVVEFDKNCINFDVPISLFFSTDESYRHVVEINISYWFTDESLALNLFHNDLGISLLEVLKQKPQQITCSYKSFYEELELLIGSMPESWKQGNK